MACRCARCSLWAALHRKSISCTLTRSVLHACASAGRHTHTCVHARTCPCMHNSHAHTGTHASIRAHAMRSAWPLGVRSYVPCLLLFSLPPFPSFPPFLSSPLSSSLPQFSPPLPFPLLSTATVRAFGFGTSESSRRARACGVQVSRPPAERDRERERERERESRAGQSGAGRCSAAAFASLHGGQDCSSFGHLGAPNVCAFACVLCMLLGLCARISVR